jgi:hypothetical protein
VGRSVMAWAGHARRGLFLHPAKDVARFRHAHADDVEHPGDVLNRPRNLVERGGADRPVVAVALMTAPGVIVTAWCREVS